jgi:tetratricopeptide (TPR) repeat protein
VTALAERVLRRQSVTETGEDASAVVNSAGSATRVSPSELPPLLVSLASRPLVGRTDERQRLLAIADDVGRGCQRVVLVSGEPGIGKTRLAACLASILSERGWSVLYGRADRETVVTYQPVIEALQHYFAHGATVDPHVLEMLGPELAALSRMVPALRTLSSTGFERSASEPELERFRVFEAVAALIASATSRCPAMLILDDLHWADRSTMTLLRHVIRTTADCSLLIFGTFRDPHEAPDAPFREFADELWHEGLLEQLSLDGLTFSDTAELVREHVPRAGEELMTRLYKRTDGNPFYVEETLRGFRDVSGEIGVTLPADTSFAVPERVKRMIEWRVERLDPPAPTLLKAAAVLGPSFELVRASSVAGMATDDAVEAFSSAHRAGLIVTDPGRPDRYAFRHALVREALYDATPPGARARLHLAAGLELERVAQAPPAELAMHFSHAVSVGGAEAAVRWRVAAAAEATLRHAYEEAVVHHVRALEALDAMPPDDRRRASILLGKGQAMIRAGEVDEGRECLRDAADLARAIRAIDIVADCALDLGSFYLSPGDVQDEVISLLEEALEGLDETADVARRARVLARLAVALYWDPASRDRREQVSHDAVRLAEADGDTHALALAVASRHAAHWTSERPAELLAEAERAIELAQRARDQELELVTRTWRLNHLLALAQIGEVDEEIDRFDELAHRLKQSRCAWYAPLFRAIRTMMTGPLDQAEKAVIEAAQLGARVPGSTAGILAGAQLFFLRGLQGRLGELEEAIAAFVESYPRQPAWRCAFALMQARLGRHERAREVIDGLSADDFSAIPRDNIWFVGVTMLGEACAISRADQHAATLERLIAPYAEVCVVSPDAAWLGPAGRVVGLLAATQGRYDDAIAHLTRASECCERVRATSILTWARLDQAEVLLRRGRSGDTEAAGALARAALTTAENAGMDTAAARALAILAPAAGVEQPSAGDSLPEEALAAG